MPTIPEIRALLARLEGEPADAIEDDQLDCKVWNQAERKSSEKLLRETVVCLANHRGGVVVLGVADKKRTRAEALVGVPLNLDRMELTKVVYDGTTPSIQVEIEELPEPEGRLLVIRVPPRGALHHTTSDGVGKIRVGKECKPLTSSMWSRGEDRRDDRVVPAATLAERIVAVVGLTAAAGALLLAGLKFRAGPPAPSPTLPSTAVPTTTPRESPTSPTSAPSPTPLPLARIRLPAPKESPTQKESSIVSRTIMVVSHDVAQDNQEVVVSLRIQNFGSAPMMISLFSSLRLDAKHVEEGRMQWLAIAPGPTGGLTNAMRHDFVTADAFQEVWEGRRVLEATLNVGYRLDGAQGLEDTQYIWVGRLDPKTHRLVIIQSEWRPVH